MSKSHDHDYSPAGQQDTTTAQLVYLGNWYKYYHLGDPQDLQEYYLTLVSLRLRPPPPQSTDGT